MSKAGWVLLATLTLACGKDAPPEEVLRPVRTETVFATGAERVRTFAGVARAGLETQLSFRVAGSVEAIPVKVGDRVRAGALIARLDRSDYEIAVRQAEAALAQAQATLVNAESDLERVRGLWENQNASQDQLDAANAAARSARAQVDGAKQTLEAARRQLAYTELKAPVDGSIASVSVDPNENVGPGQTIVLLTSGSRPEVELAIPEILIARINEGDDVRIRFDALPDATYDGVVTEVGVASTGTATTFPVTVRLREASRDVRSGMAANVTFTFRPTGQADRIYLPSHAVVEDRDGRFVFVLEPADESQVGHVRRTDVQVGGFVGDRLEIVSGLSEGQQVVTAGTRLLTDGQRVRLLPDQATAQ